MDDLNRALKVADIALAAQPEGSHDRVTWLSSLGISLARRFGHTGTIHDLNNDIENTDMAVKATPQRHSDRAGLWLRRQFERTVSMDDFNGAVQVAQMAVDATPHDHPDRVVWMSNPENSLGRQIDRTGSTDDLNFAVQVAQMAVDATPHNHPDRVMWMIYLVHSLGSRFEHTGSMDDLSRVVQVADIAVNAVPENHPDRGALLDDLGHWLGTRFDRTGSMDDLNRAVQVANMAVDATPHDHPDRVMWMNNLGNSLSRRFEYTGSMDDLNRAVQVAQMAVDVTPLDHPDRVKWMNSLGVWLGRRFEHTGSIDDLNRAVQVTDAAVNAAWQHHPSRAKWLNNLGNWLGMRFERTGSTDDLNRAVQVAQMAVDVTPVDHPDRVKWLLSLGNWLGIRFQHIGVINDLNRAVEVTDVAVNATPEDHPSRAVLMNSLGNWLEMRSQSVEPIDDLNRALSSYRGGWRCKAAAPSIRIDLALGAARILAQQSKWDESSQLLEGAVKLLPSVSPRSLQNSDKQHMLSNVSGLASTAAATLLNAGGQDHHALELLELGRGVIAGLLLDMRTDMSALRRQCPQLANEFISLRDELDSPSDCPTLPSSGETSSSPEALLKRRREVEIRFNQLIQEIRSKSGFEDFLHPPAAEQLMAAADPDPIIVVNAHFLRCDAFIVDRQEIKVLKLRSLTLEDAERNVKCLRSSEPAAEWSVLEWLWNVAAQPIMDALGFRQTPSNGDWPHVWWILVGPLSQLPFHAAGRHVQGSSDAVLDRVMSSYSTSIKALMHRH